MKYILLSISISYILLIPPTLAQNVEMKKGGLRKGLLDREDILIRTDKLNEQSRQLSFWSSFMSFVNCSPRDKNCGSHSHSGSSTSSGSSSSGSGSESGSGSGSGSGTGTGTGSGYYTGSMSEYYTGSGSNAGSGSSSSSSVAQSSSNNGNESEEVGGGGSGIANAGQRASHSAMFWSLVIFSSVFMFVAALEIIERGRRHEPDLGGNKQPLNTEKQKNLAEIPTLELPNITKPEDTLNGSELPNITKISDALNGSRKKPNSLCEKIFCKRFRLCRSSDDINPQLPNITKTEHTDLSTDFVKIEI